MRGRRVHAHVGQLAELEGVVEAASLVVVDQLAEARHAVAVSLDEAGPPRADRRTRPPRLDVDAVGIDDANALARQAGADPLQEGLLTKRGSKVRPSTRTARTARGQRYIDKCAANHST